MKCPVCGWKLYDADSGTWCLNPDCKVMDDYKLYQKKKIAKTITKAFTKKEKYASSSGQCCGKNAQKQTK